MNSVEEKKQRLIKSLSKFEGKDERLKFIIGLGRNMPPMDPKLKIDQFLVRGCISKAWLVPEFKDGSVTFHADSEAMTVKGIMSVLLEVLDGLTPQQILEEDGTFLAEVGITEHLSMNRRNGLANFLELIHTYARAFQG